MSTENQSWRFKEGEAIPLDEVKLDQPLSPEIAAILRGAHGRAELLGYGGGGKRFSQSVILRDLPDGVRTSIDGLSLTGIYKGNPISISAPNITRVEATDYSSQV